MSSKQSKISRRTFTRGAIGLGLAPLIIPSSAFSKPSSKQINVGVIGVGGRGSSHIADGLRNSKNVRILAVCDVNRPNCDKAKATVDKINDDNACLIFEDFRELLAHKDIDAITVAVPDQWHALITIAAAQAGKHIYSEKPLAYSVVEGRAMVDAVKTAGVVFQHGTQQRSTPNFWQACMLVRNGRIGKLETIRVGSPYGLQGGDPNPAPVPAGLNYDFWLGPAPEKPYTPGRCTGQGGKGWYQLRDYSGGWITAWGSHDLDIAQWGNGTDDTGPVKVTGHAEYPTAGVYDTAWKWHFDCTYANGTKLIYASEDENPHGVRFEGSDGWIFVKRGVLEAHKKSLLEETFDDSKIQLVKSLNHMGNFVDAIITGKATAAPIEVAHRSTTIAHLCNIAAQTGRTLQWKPAEEGFVNDDGANALLSRDMRAPWEI
ncbi:MAG: Gfo/Idh/MocA family oxidoreductase [Candidatus Hydrogenedentes bacterium]|nr:Gfo/Idh/MocA family oxidoreductase [Candidatus Hydrogenedentota bacterium]